MTTSQLTLTDALRIARGCLDYGGGYRGGPELEIYHHGIETVINALAAAEERGLVDTQVAALHLMGKPMLCGPCGYTDRGYQGPCLCGHGPNGEAFEAASSLKKEFLEHAKGVHPKSYAEYIAKHPGAR